MLVHLTRTEQQARVLAALSKGPIRSIGGIVYDSAMLPICSTDELYWVTRQNLPNNQVIVRIDAGGSPRWELQ
jgi:hypothetical protein